MKTTILILAMAIAAVELAQGPPDHLALNNVVSSGDGRWLMAKATPGEPQTPAPVPHPHHRFGGFAFATAVVNTPFSTKPLPPLAGETGCNLTVENGPKTIGSQGWKLADGIFSGTPTALGNYRLQIACTTPDAVTESIRLRVLKTLPPAPKPNPNPSPKPVPIPLN